MNPEGVYNKSESPVKIAWTPYKSGDKNIKENSIGSVIPVINDVSAIPIIRPAVAFRFSGFAVTTMARHAAGRPNIITGKNPVIKTPALGSPLKNRAKSPVAPLNSPN